MQAAPGTEPGYRVLQTLGYPEETPGSGAIDPSPGRVDAAVRRVTGRASTRSRQAPREYGSISSGSCFSTSRVQLELN